MEIAGRYALDLRLGLRMLRRDWGLTLVGGFAITVVVALATGSVSFLHTTLDSPVPLDAGERLVGVSLWDAARQRRVRPSLAQFERWRAALQSVEDLSAFASVDRRPAFESGLDEQPVVVAEMTASAFRAARVPALLGRTFGGADERPGAPPVVVIGHEVWQSRYGSSADVVGRSLRLSGTEHEIIGVMPESFGFPVNHRYWTPLKLNELDDATEVFVFGRLADGHEIEGAQAEVEAIGIPPEESAAERPPRVPQVLPYTRALIGSGEPLEHWLAEFGGFIVSLLLLPPCLNIAILVYARTVTRREELAMRCALGASKSRIVGQLFLEIFVLAAIASALALALVHAFFGLDLFRSESDPFWLDYTNVSITTVPFAAGLAIVAALIAGTLPAVQVTRGLERHGLAISGHRATLRLGKTWTLLVVAQVALAVAALPAAVELGWGKLRPSLLGPGFAAERYLTFGLGFDDHSLAASSLDRASKGLVPEHITERLVRRLEDDPDVLAASVSSALPAAEPRVRVEVDAGSEVSSSGFELVRINRVDAAYLDLFGIDVIAGRPLQAGDLERTAAPVVVNRTLSERIGGVAPGQRIRIASRSGDYGDWQQIVGVVADHPASSEEPRVYAALPNAPLRAKVTVRLRTDAASIAIRLPEIVAGLDPQLYVVDARLLADVYRRIEIGNSMQFIALAAVMLSVVLLSVSGVYAMLSFTVSRRRQEIGIRSALGAQPARIVFGVFRRALWQVAAGALLGLGVSVLLDYFLPMERVGGRGVPGVLFIVAAAIIVIGCLAALVPARRALRVAPTDALRELG